MFDWLWQGVTDKVQPIWEWFTDPLWRWYAWSVVGFLIAGVIMWFFGWLKYVRVAVSIAVLLGAAFVLGGRQMHKEMKDKLEEERARRRELEQQRGQGQNGGGGWWW